MHLYNRVKPKIKKMGKAGFSCSSWLLTRVEKERQADFSEARQGDGDTVMGRDLSRRGLIALDGADPVVVGFEPQPTVSRGVGGLLAQEGVVTGGASRLRWVEENQG